MLAQTDEYKDTTLAHSPVTYTFSLCTSMEVTVEKAFEPSYKQIHSFVRLTFTYALNGKYEVTVGVCVSVCLCVSGYMCVCTVIYGQPRRIESLCRNHSYTIREFLESDRAVTAC